MDHTGHSAAASTKLLSIQRPGKEVYPSPWNMAPRSARGHHVINDDIVQHDRLSALARRALLDQH